MAALRIIPDSRVTARKGKYSVNGILSVSCTDPYQVRRGEKGTQVQYWRFDEERKIKDAAGRPVLDPNEEPRTEKVRLERPQVFIAYVFNDEQIDGVPPAPSRACAWKRGNSRTGQSRTNLGSLAVPNVNRLG